MGRLSELNYNNDSEKKIVKGIEWNKNSPKEVLQYAIGALLYAPADHKTIGVGICEGKYPNLKNIVFCLEDTILDKNLENAEKSLASTIKMIGEAVESKKIIENTLPLIFIRVRNSKQMLRVFENIKQYENVITGFALPKFDSKNKEQYEEAVWKINEEASFIKYIMPIIESFSVMDKKTRMKELYGIKETIDKISDYVLNVRVGGNDFCNLFGLRRGRNDTIYDIAIMKDVLSDIMNIFGKNYIISAPVWEYFGEENDDRWLKGLKKELKADKLNGFIGKTVIHPCQLPIVQKAYIVENSDYQDALAILNWQSNTSGVEKGILSQRMNEIKVHERWAMKTIALANIYGVKESEV